MSHDLHADLEAARRLAEAHHLEAGIGLDRIALGTGVIADLEASVSRVSRPGPIVMFEDATAMRIGDSDLKGLAGDLLAGVGPTRRVVLGPPDGRAHADAATIGSAAEAGDGAGCLVSVGSGTVTDVAKEAARITGAPLVVVQTAASVNGYADGMAVILRDGVKRTVPSAWATELLVDTDVLVSAPSRLTRSGFAEMMAMFTAPADWRLAAAIGLDPGYDAEAISMFAARGDRLLESGAQVGASEPEALELLALLLTQSGLAMGAVGRTAPLSGTEHLISHLLDMSAVATGEPAGLHGAQVGVAAVIAACIWERALRRIEPAQLAASPPAPEVAEEMVAKAFAEIDPGGQMAAECWSDYQRKLSAWSAIDRDPLVDRWPALRSELEGMLRPPDRIVSALGRAGAPSRFRELDIDPERARWAIASCHLMRDRFTIVDLVALTGGWGDEDVEAVLERAGGLGSGL